MLLSIVIWTPCLGQNDTAYKMSLRQQDSAIRFSEGVKTLVERYNFKVKESDTFKSLWRTEVENRAKDAADYKIIIDGYSAIETSNRIQIATLNRKYKGQVRKARLMLIISIGAVGYGIYQTLK